LQIEWEAKKGVEKQQEERGKAGPHFPCVGHCLHLIVGPLLVEKKKKPLLIMIDGGKESIDDTEIIEDVDATDDVFEDPDEIWSSQECLTRVRSVVDDFRKATVFLRRFKFFNQFKIYFWLNRMCKQDGTQHTTCSSKWTG
jgi:hypothetical protein